MTFTKCLQFVCSPCLRYVAKYLHGRLRSHSRSRVRSGRSGGGQTSAQLGSPRGRLRGGILQYRHAQRRSSGFSVTQRRGSTYRRRSIQRTVSPVSIAGFALVLSGHQRSRGRCRFGARGIFACIQTAQHVPWKFTIFDLAVCDHSQPLSKFIEKTSDRAGCGQRTHAGRPSRHRRARSSSGNGARSVLPTYVELDTNNPDADRSARDGAALRSRAALCADHPPDDAHEPQRRQSLHCERATKAESSLAQR